jgi:hypothetical protein
MLVVEAESPDSASIVANDGSFVVAWHTVGEGGSPGQSIWGTVMSEDGEQLVAPRPITEPAPVARSHSLVPLGDRLILLWSELRNGGYDIYSRELSPRLEPLGEARPITSFETEAYGPQAAVGPNGEIGVMLTAVPPGQFAPQVYFTSLACDAGEGDGRAEVDSPR